MKNKLFELPTCSICLQELQFQIANLPCGHVYHRNCIFKYYEHSNQCPLCKNRFFQHHISRLIFQAVQIASSQKIIQQFLKDVSQESNLEVLQLLTKFEKKAIELSELRKQLKESEGRNKANQQLLINQSKKIQGLEQARTKQQARESQLQIQLIGANCQLQTFMKKYVEFQYKIKRLQEEKSTVDNYRQACKFLQAKQVVKDLQSLDRTVFQERVKDALTVQINKNHLLRQNLQRSAAQLHQQRRKSSKLNQLVKQLRSQNQKLLSRLRKLESRLKSQKGKVQQLQSERSLSITFKDLQASNKRVYTQLPIESKKVEQGSKQTSFLNMMKKRNQSQLKIGKNTFKSN